MGLLQGDFSRPGRALGRTQVDPGGGLGASWCPLAGFSAQPDLSTDREHLSVQADQRSRGDDELWGQPRGTFCERTPPSGMSVLLRQFGDW